MRLGLPSTPVVGDRCGVSERAVAAIASSVLHDVGLITSNNSDLSVIFSLILLPVRFLLMILILTFAWLIGVLTLHGISKEQAEGLEPLTGWRRHWAKPFIVSVARFVFVVGGWFWIPQKGRRANAQEAPILLVMPHSSFLDTVLVIALGCPSMVVKDSTERTPFFGSKSMAI
ncbi:Lysophosphatidylcholine acyltransferase [Araneus ventricosus]|uniref:Lysophosphatidylcholine acyltransferase n=1 Tax=Araneus ventricosus TaxID=182803 RepID=A0A4Y2WCB2_ARAVE|nr:Lysophosphatidylcholine acyltransferase [Araneus ventricosus]